ncbi:transposase, IS605 OrfB family, central region [Carboxydocella sporoproducens DSM 16521]|uniref:Transposase, IS605 OrfB family, central region n=2 Tax=Carboxydocella TaxID=178898 RepID=A0A1T4PDM6_9FIRM|nr:MULTISPECIES: RNA-guided endonuclease TnpB family protein [Carboxydocella]AVX21420.1 transposase, IS605 OrfB family, central region [Carboxydocella thermautotrophica]AVX31908.1 transposase, IS605 OrfB family, central region [Carboxydocella thermautotrophica]SJZ89644.1 transposase, IS605 OrfB family, central region [Carboxydocella sporoproducens DSM 16521]
MPLITLKAQVHADSQTEAVLKDAMFCATKVYNGLLWHLREEYKENGKVNISRKNLNRILKELPRVKGYYSMSVQLTRDEVREAYRSFFALKKKGLTQHKAPGFRHKNYLSPLKYVQSGFRVDKNRVTLSLGTSREDGVKQVSFRISHRPGIEYDRVRELSITYDKISGQIEARLVVEVKARENSGTERVAVDLGETVLMACAFGDGTVTLYSGRLVKAIRRYWQKVRASLQRNSRRWGQVAHREKKQVEQLLHVATSHFIAECVRRGVKEIAIGDINGIRESTDYGDQLNQRLHAWPYRKLINMLKYKGALAGIVVRDDVNERGTSVTCHVCGRVLSSNRKSRGLYECSCGWRAQADVNGALNIFEKKYKVSPIKGSSGRVARLVVLSFRLGWHGVHEPKRGDKNLRASA